jgi:hypothetical protein
MTSGGDTLNQILQLIITFDTLPEYRKFAYRSMAPKSLGSNDFS